MNIPLKQLTSEQLSTILQMGIVDMDKIHYFNPNIFADHIDHVFDYILKSYNFDKMGIVGKQKALCFSDEQMQILSIAASQAKDPYDKYSIFAYLLHDNVNYRNQILDDLAQATLEDFKKSDADDLFISFSALEYLGCKNITYFSTDNDLKYFEEMVKEIFPNEEIFFRKKRAICKTAAKFDQESLKEKISKEIIDSLGEHSEENPSNGVSFEFLNSYSVKFFPNTYKNNKFLQEHFPDTYRNLHGLYQIGVSEMLNKIYELRYGAK